MNKQTDITSVLNFLDNFAVEFSSLCGGLRLAALHLPLASSCQDERDALNLFSLILTGLERQEQLLADNLSAFIQPQQ